MVILNANLNSCRITIMGETGEVQKQDPESDKKPEQKVYDLKLRGALFDYIANRLAPIYLNELADLKKDGAYKPLTEFFDSPFATAMTKIMILSDESPKRGETVEIKLLDEEYAAIVSKMPKEENYLQARIRREMLAEFKMGFRDAKFNARLKGAASSIKKTFRGKKS